MVADLSIEVYSQAASQTRSVHGTRVDEALWLLLDFECCGEYDFGRVKHVEMEFDRVVVHSIARA